VNPALQGMSKRRIVITGFMGSGKTAVAEALARLLDCAAADLDQIITIKEGSSPKEIIEGDGEECFRAIETRMLSQLLEEDLSRVIALGGGAWTVAGNRRAIEEYGCFSVWLDAPFELCWQRILEAGDERPLAPDKQTARRLYQKRRHLYEQVDMRIEINAGTKINEIASRIAANLQLANQ
jgi:shikimate kinase